MAEMCEFIEKSGKKFLYKVEYDGKEEVWPFNHEQVLTFCPFYDDEIPVDSGLSDFLVFLWSLGLVTTNSCERQSDGSLFPNSTWIDFADNDGMVFLNLLDKAYKNKLQNYKVKDWIAPPKCWVVGSFNEGMSIRFDADRLEEVFTNMRDYVAEMGIL